jgi:nifR3 family TIM-barrel protein
MAYTQMVAADGMCREDAKTLDILDLGGGERLIGMQVFGCDPDKLADAARSLQNLGATVVDLNMGCPARKVTGSNGGSALLRKPDLVARIFEAMRAAVSMPLTAKMRWDWDEDSGAAIEIGRLAERAGLDGVCLHARTREQGYSGRADWDKVRQLKQAVSIPVVGNGDVRSAADAVEMMRQTGCDAVMIGRAAMGDPWLLGRALRRVKKEVFGDPADDPSIELHRASEEVVPFETRRDVMLRHAEMMIERKGPRGMIEFRKHAAAYMRGLRGARRLRRDMAGLVDLASLRRALDDAFDPAFAEEEPAIVA